jgi:hypothetical protein
MGIDIKKYSLTEVALLCFFALGLAIAHFMVSERNKIRLCEAIWLESGDLSASVPVGRGWAGFERWEYQKNNSFVLAATFKIRGRLAGSVECRYLLAPNRLSGQERLDESIGEKGLEIVESGRLEEKELLTEWAQCVRPGEIEDYVIGITLLPDGRRVETSAMAIGDYDLAKRIFRSVAESIEIAANSEVEQGDVFFEQLRRKGASRLVKAEVGESMERIYIAGDAAGNLAGFMVDSFEEDDSGGSGVMRNQRLHYTNDNRLSGNCMFQCSMEFDEFVWNSKHSRAGVQSISQLETRLSGSGRLETIELTSGEKVEYWPRHPILPNVLLDSAVRAFMDFDAEAVIIDVVFPRGMIVPTRLLKVEVSQGMASNENIEYVVRVDFLYGQKRFEEVYFDVEKNILGKLEHKTGVLMWNRRDRETLSVRFSEWKNYIEMLL